MRNLEQEASSFTPCSDWAQSTLASLLQRSPISLHVSLAAMRATLKKTRYGTFQREYELASHFMLQPDFVNGVTARLIKRTEPKWSLPPEAISQSPEWVSTNIFEGGHFDEPLEQSFYMLSEGRQDLVTKERGVFTYSLPMESSVLATLMKGKMDGSVDEDAKYTRKELTEYITGENLGRAGAERKLNFILDRKTVDDEFGKLIWKFDHIPSK